MYAHEKNGNPAPGQAFRVSGHRASGQPPRTRDNPDHQSDQPLIIVVEPVGHRGRFRARLGGRIIVSQAGNLFFDAARALITEGCDPAVTLIVRHAGAATDALIARQPGAAERTGEAVRARRGGGGEA